MKLHLSKTQALQHKYRTSPASAVPYVATSGGHRVNSDGTDCATVPMRVLGSAPKRLSVLSYCIHVDVL